MVGAERREGDGPVAAAAGEGPSSRPPRGGGAVGWARRAARAVLARADGLVDRLYGSRLNPLYHSGAIVVALLVVLLVTGLYLLIFYRIGAPHGSVARITGQAWTGRWIRSLHRYASDAAVVAAAVHAFRLFAQGRSWGPRALAWVSGVLLLFVLFVSGWTGYVMVWDGQAELLAIEGARFLDALPLFSEPVSRAFVGERELPGAFFFLNLFLHIALPIGLGILLWVHVSRLARPALFPPRRLLWGGLALLLILSVAWPVGMTPPADLLHTADEAVLDLFYAFWLPLTRELPVGAVWGLGAVIGGAVLLVPWWTRPRLEARPEPSGVDERLCTGCEQCWLDCPYEAIHMAPRTDGRAELVAVVDPDLCVSCGICAGSCAPMGVGPPGMTGRDQLAAARAFLEERRPGPGEVVLVGCDRGPVGRSDAFSGVPVFRTPCAGNLHTSVVELLVRSGSAGVVIVSCPERDCWNREGPKWLEARMYHDREAELKERVDRRRVRLLAASATQVGRVWEALRRFTAEVEGLEAVPEDRVEVETECEVPRPVEVGG